MLKKILIGVGVLFLAFVLWAAYGIFIAEPASPPAVTEYSQDGLDISISYSQPYKKGRMIFGEEAEGALLPYGKFWRLGANAATEISINKDVLFGGQALSAGTYRMYAVPGAESFKVTLNSELDVFFGISEADPELDILSFTAPVSIQEDVTEMFTINVNKSDKGAQIDFVWDTVMFSVPVVVN